MTTRHAACSCGQLALVAEGDPVRISVCHCLACQKRTGSIFGVQSRFPRDKVSIEGRSTRYTRTADSGNQIMFHFCPECGATVYYEFGFAPDFVGVPVGAFADPSFPAPKISVYEAHKHAWAVVPDDIEHLD
jgi:hypothetical protein